MACPGVRSRTQIGRPADFEVVSDGLLVAEANNRGEPFIKLGPDAVISHDVRRIAQRLTIEAGAAREKRQAVAAGA